MKNAKFIVAIVTAALTGVVPVLPIGSTAALIINFILTVLGAVAVYFVPNARPEKTPPAPVPATPVQRPPAPPAV